MTGPPAEKTWNDVVAKFTDCGVCGIPATNWIKVSEGYAVPRCHAHRLDKPYQAESRLAVALASGGSGERLLTEAECDRRIASHLGAMEAELCGGSGEAPAGLTREEAEAQLSAQAVALDAIERLPADVRAKYQQGPWWDGIVKLRAALRGPVGGGPGGEGEG